MGRGAFIVIEGLDRAGKSTQVKRLVETLASRGHTASSVTFPERTTMIGKVIDSYLKGGTELDDAAIHLLFSANRWEVAQSIRSRLESGETIVSDRYAFSGAAFTAAKGKRSLEWCKASDKGLPSPDVVIYLEISPESAGQRGGFGAERYETADFQDKVRRQFDELRAEGGQLWQAVDASPPLDQVAAGVEAIAVRVMAQVQLLPIKNLGDDTVGTVLGGLGGFGFGRTSS